MEILNNDTEEIKVQQMHCEWHVPFISTIFMLELSSQ